MADEGVVFPSIPYLEAIAALKRRGLNLQPSGHWTEVWQQCHQTAFTVARSAGFDILSDVHAALVKAMEQGQTFAQFCKGLKPLLQRKGWWGRTEDAVQLGSTRRLATIFDVNIRVSKAQADWADFQAMKHLRPYLRYVGILDGNIRPLHRAWHGRILPVDHPWWKTHYPPNGWRCRCDALSISKDDLQTFGWKVSENPPDDGTTPWTNPRTGEVHDVPRGIDPGWDYNPGDTDMAARAAKLAMEKVGSLPPSLAVPALEEMIRRVPATELAVPGVAPTVVRQVIAAGLASWIEKPMGNFPLAVIPAQDAAAIGSTARIAKISPETLAKQQRHHPELTATDYQLVQQAVESGEKYQQDGKNLAYVLNQGGGVVAIVKATKIGDELFVTSVRRLSRKDVERQRAVEKLKK